jgi:hypothetical protein
MENQQGERPKGIADLVFLIDATGSMAPCIDALKRNIEMFIDKLTVPTANNETIVKDWRAKVIGYRDFEVDSKPFEDSPFVRDAASLKSQLAMLKADGGGDEAETLLDALFKVSTMGSTDKGGSEDANKWRYRSSAARVVVIFTDAPYKEKMVIPEGAGGTVDDVINRLQENRIILSIFAPEMRCYDTLGECQFAAYNKIMLEGRSPQDALAKFTSDEKNFRATLEALAKSISKSGVRTPSL